MLVSTGPKDWVEEVRAVPNNRMGAGRFNRALSFWDSRQIRDAKTFVGYTLDEDPDLGEAHILLGNIHAYKNRPEEAIKEYDRAEKYDDLRLVAQTNKVIIYTALREFKLAERILVRLLNQYQYDSVVLAAAGYFYLNMFSFEVSISYLERSIEQGSIKKSVYVDLSFLYSTYSRNFQKIVDLFKSPKLPLAVRKHTLFLNNLAYAFIKLDRLTEGQEILNEIDKESWRRDADPSVAYTILATQGLLSLYKNDLQGGSRLYKAAKRIAPEDRKALVHQKRLLESGNYYFRMEESLEAENAYLRALRVETSLGLFLNYSEEILEQLETIYQSDARKESTEGYLRTTNEGIAIEVPLSKIPRLLSFLNDALRGRIVSITFKKDGQHVIEKFPSKLWFFKTRNLVYYFLLSSTMIEWKKASLFSGGDGYFFLKVEEGLKNSVKDRIAASLQERIFPT